MESEKKTWMEKAQESAMDTAMKNVASALSGKERGGWVSSCFDKRITCLIKEMKGG